MKGLIVYYSKYGGCEEITRQLQTRLDVDCVNVKSFNQNLNDYDYIIIGFSVYVGMLSSKCKSFIQDNENELLKKPLFMFHAGLSKDKEIVDKVYQENFERDIIDRILYYDCLGGCLPFKKMNFFEKTIIKMINKEKKIVNKEQMKENVNLIDDDKIKTYVDNVKISMGIDMQ